MENFSSKNNIFDDEQSELEIREFVRRLDGQQIGVSNKKRSSQNRRRKYSLIDIPEVLWFVGGILIILAVILAGILLCKVPTLVVMAITLLEVALAVCLNQEQLWLHMGVIILNIILGLVFHMIIFMLLASVAYGITILLAFKKL